MKKFYLFFAFVLILSSSLFAQRQGISIGGNVYFPVGDWAEFASIGYGASTTYEHQLGRNIAGVISVAYISFSGDEEGTSWSMIPALAGVKFYFSPKMDWYITGLLGANFVEAEVSGTTPLGETYSESASSTEFAFSANLGYELMLSEKGALDISGGFQYISDLSYFGLRLAYKFIL
jgi:hypothetical protein